jgi:hypothetical protein
MSSQIPMEYVMLQKKLGTELNKILAEDLFQLLIVGSSANSTVYPGVSDVNFLIVLNDPDKLSASPFEVTNKALELIKQYKDNPMFTTLVDFEIYFESQMPTDNGLNGMSGIKALALKSALVFDKTSQKFVDKGNPYEKLKIDSGDLRAGASSLVKDCLNRLSSIIAEPQFETDDEDENEGFDDKVNDIEFECIETTLLSAQAYLMVKKGTYVSKVDVPFIAEEEPVEGLDHNLLTIVSTKRQGADYAGGYTEDEDFDSDDLADSGKESGVIHKMDNLPEVSMNLIATIVGLINKL